MSIPHLQGALVACGMKPLDKHNRANCRKTEILQWSVMVLYKYTGSQVESWIPDTATTTIKTNKHSRKNQSSFQLIQCFKRTLKPKPVILVAPKTWWFVPVEHSHSRNDSPASCSVKGSRKKSAQRVQHETSGWNYGKGSRLNDWNTCKWWQARLSLLSVASPHHILLGSHQLCSDCSSPCKAVDLDLQVWHENITVFGIFPLSHKTGVYYLKLLYIQSIILLGSDCLL